MGGSLRPLTDALGGIASGDMATELRAAIAATGEKQMLAEFRESRDPWGGAWASIARMGKRLRRGFAGPRRMGKPLMDSGQLRGSRIAAATSDGAEFGLSAPYAGYQQDGTGTRLGPGRGGIIPRPMLPIGRGEDIGTWGPVFERVTNAIVRKHAAGEAL